MKSKIVENWLTKVNELTFTIPFSQLLVSQGHKVVHISSQGPLEQGKDVISVAPDGMVHCYQLKCGKINGRVWGEIKSEIDQLVELPPKHPSLPKEVEEWEAYLVTNGSIANPTARDIYDYAESKKGKGHRPLKTMVGGELVAAFTEFYDDFLPVDALDLQIFLEIYNQNGDFELDTQKFKLFFESFFQASHDVSRQRKVESIRASIVLCNYLLSLKHEAENHLGIIKGYVLLLASIYEFCDEHKIAGRLWKDSESLVYEAIEIQFRRLTGELQTLPDGYVQRKYGVLSEVVTHKIRCSELLGYISAFKSYYRLRHGQKPEISETLDSLTSSMIEHRALLGEVFIPYFVNYIADLHHEGKEAEAATHLTHLVVALSNSHLGEKRGLPSPYYNLTESVNWALGRGRRIEEDFQWRSHSMHALTLMSAHLGLRDVISSLWPVISRISREEMIPNEPRDYFFWRMENGTLYSSFPDVTQSWAALQNEAAEDYSDSLPETLKDRKFFLPLFINAMPHRFNHRFALLLLNKKQA
ncbi:hypothetical protein ACWD64_17225 [Streptomyces antibioticus]